MAWLIWSRVWTMDSPADFLSITLALCSILQPFHMGPGGKGRGGPVHYIRTRGPWYLHLAWGQFQNRPCTNLIPDVYFVVTTPLHSYSVNLGRFHLVISFRSGMSGFKSTWRWRIHTYPLWPVIDIMMRGRKCMLYIQFLNDRYDGRFELEPIMAFPIHQAYVQTLVP